MRPKGWPYTLIDAAQCKCWVAPCTAFRRSVRTLTFLCIEGVCLDRQSRIAQSVVRSGRRTAPMASMWVPSPIGGVVQSGIFFDPDLIAESCW